MIHKLNKIVIHYHIQNRKIKQDTKENQSCMGV